MTKRNWRGSAPRCHGPMAQRGQDWQHQQFLISRSSLLGRCEMSGAAGQGGLDRPRSRCDCGESPCPSPPVSIKSHRVELTPITALVEMMVVSPGLALLRKLRIASTFSNQLDLKPRRDSNVCHIACGYSCHTCIWAFSNWRAAAAWAPVHPSILPWRSARQHSRTARRGEGKGREIACETVCQISCLGGSHHLSGHMQWLDSREVCWLETLCLA